MLMSREMISEALRYNMQAIARRSIHIGLLPYPLNEEMSTISMVAWVYAFQQDKGMRADGKLDPETYELLRTDEGTISMRVDPISKREIE